MLDVCSSGRTWRERVPAPAPDLRPKAPTVIGAPRQPPFADIPAGRPSTKTLFEIHTGCCRVRRKRKRLTSNGSIESDAAISRHPDPRRISPHHFDRELTFVANRVRVSAPSEPNFSYPGCSRR